MSSKCPCQNLRMPVGVGRFCFGGGWNRASGFIPMRDAEAKPRIFMIEYPYAEIAHTNHSCDYGDRAVRQPRRARRHDVERLSGRILLQVQAHGEAWYVNPLDEARYYMKDGATAYAMLSQFGLGISEKDFTTLRAGDKSMIDRLQAGYSSECNREVRRIT